mmetsp:Transcript_58839/g.187837  ORF Transcript_58839/g.187837 Transcript_58839/m.187837 type:complete len:447 (+) Transcript_58839:607-1947(+)
MDPRAPLLHVAVHVLVHAVQDNERRLVHQELDEEEHHVGSHKLEARHLAAARGDGVDAQLEVVEQNVEEHKGGHEHVGQHLRGEVLVGVPQNLIRLVDRVQLLEGLRVVDGHLHRDAVVLGLAEDERARSVKHEVRRLLGESGVAAQHPPRVERHKAPEEGAPQLYRSENKLGEEIVAELDHEEHGHAVVPRYRPPPHALPREDQAHDERVVHGHEQHGDHGVVLVGRQELVRGFGQPLGKPRGQHAEGECVAGEYVEELPAVEKEGQEREGEADGGNQVDQARALRKNRAEIEAHDGDPAGPEEPHGRGRAHGLGRGVEGLVHHRGVTNQRVHGGALPRRAPEQTEWHVPEEEEEDAQHVRPRDGPGGRHCPILVPWKVYGGGHVVPTRPHLSCAQCRDYHTVQQAHLEHLANRVLCGALLLQILRRLGGVPILCILLHQETLRA